MMAKFVLVYALISFLVISQLVIFGINREVFFDDAFSLQTVHILRTEGISSIDFRHYDVHSPTYYYLLWVWSYLNPGITDYHWAQELSVLIMMGFLVFVYLGLKKWFGLAGETAVMPIALCSVYLHFGTECRMYALTLLFSAIIFYGIAKGKYRLASVCMILLPLTHYYAAMAIPFYAVFAYVVIKNTDQKLAKDWVWFVVAGVAGILLAGFVYALPQAQRAGSAFFAISSIMSWPSSVLFAFFMTDGVLPSIPYTLIYVGILAAIVIFFWKAFETISNKFELKKAVMVMMGSTIIFPLFVLMFISLTGEYANLYHHRFFLVITWMFAALCFVGIIEFGKKQVDAKRGYLAILIYGLMFVAMGFMFFQYGVAAHHELQNLMNATPCFLENKIYIAHESAFSALTFEVWAREHNCNWYNFISTNLSQKRMNGGGGDAMPKGSIYYNFTLPIPSGFYYVRSSRTIPVGSSILVKQEDGVELVFVYKIYEEGVAFDQDIGSWNVSGVANFYDEAEYLASLNGTCKQAGDCFIQYNLTGCQQQDCNWCCNTKGVLAGCTLLYCMAEEEYKDLNISLNG
jgi:hypothetical protein